MSEYPLYPKLSEEAKKEADLYMQQFKDKMKKVAEETLSDVYTSCVEYIESDSWTNFRNEVIYGFKNYNNRKIQSEYDFKIIRESIYKDFHDEIIADLNKDLLKENDELKKQVKSLKEDINKITCLRYE